MPYQIGDFSKISRLSIKTLRYYHECGLLTPTYTDRESGYRYYDQDSLARASIIKELKELDFSLKDIKEILDSCTDDEDLTAHAINKSKEIKEKIAHYDEMQKKLEAFIKQTNQAEELKMLNINPEIVIKDVPDILIASIRFKGRYQDITPVFLKIFKHCGRYCSGAPFSLYYDGEYKEEDADIEACIPMRTHVAADGIQCRQLKGGKAVTIIHKGPYETVGDSYKVLIDHINENCLNVQPPNREIYIKGPGMILPRSPRKFVTEIQLVMKREG